VFCLTKACQLTPSGDGQSRDNRCDGCHRVAFAATCSAPVILTSESKDLGALAVHATRSIRILPT